MKRRDFLKGALIGSGLLTSGLLPGSGRTSDWGKRKQGKDIYRIDSFCHFTTFKYIEWLEAHSFYPNSFRPAAEPNPSMYDIDARLKMMDDCGIDLSILVPLPNIETAGPVYNDPTLALQAAQFINNEIAEIVAQHPRRFLGVALLPTTNADIMLNEFERAVKQLHAVGGYFIVSPTAKPPDDPDYMSLYGKSVELNVPLWLHPSRPMTYPDYTLDPVAPSPPYPPNTRLSKDWLYLILGWVLDSSIAMSRIVFKGVFDTYPSVKLITHHRGAMVPLFANRLQGSFEFFDEMGLGIDTTISKPYIEHFKKFYCDTTCSLGPEVELVKAAYDFFGPDRVLFGTDAPYSTHYGRDGTMASRYNVQTLNITNKALENIFSNNILRIIPH
jgi:predicted TIM-barrel fold metal-dependent hydrolase